jgi:phosphoribosylformylglycinamidine (FGAM) synthase PurS component
VFAVEGTGEVALGSLRGDAAEAERVGREAADRVLANGLIEGYEVVVEGTAAEELVTE